MNNQVAQVSKKELAAAEPMVPVGYKQTEVGVIPEDWEVSAIADKHTIATGSTPPTANPKNYGEDFLFVSPADLSDKKYILTTEKKLSKQGFALSKKYPSGSTLFTCIGSTIGKTGFATEELTSNQQINAVFPSEDSDTEFTYYAITYIAPKVKALAGQQAVPLVNKSEFGETIFGFPRERKEQTAIANTLSDVDALIGSLEALIAKKQAIKTATMQQLLTGRTRLPQFAIQPDGSPKGYKTSELGEIPEDWAVVPFGSLFDSKSTQRKKLAEDEEVSFVGMQDVSESSRLIQTRQLAYSRVKSGLTYFERGDVLVAKITPCFENGKGCHTETLKTEVGFGSTEFHVLKANQDADSWFIYFWTIQADFRMKLESEMVGSAGHRRVPLSAITAFNIPSPSCREEQTAIAAILSDMDEEIQALETRLAKTRDLKQGMMQQLLTGKIRLVKPLARGEHHAG
ncbi:restriction endonuclease subunit S [Zobellella taiwanensis]